LVCFDNERDERTEDVEENPKKKFRLFGNIYAKDGPGVEKDELKAMEDPSLVHYFKLLKRKFSKLFSVNLLYILGNFPIIFFFLQYLEVFREEFAANTYSIYPTLYGVSLFDKSPATSTLLGVFGRVTPGYAHTTASIVLLCLSLLVIFTFGLVNVGTTYILRSMVREEPVFLLSDFKYAVKRNLKQGFIMGIIDVAIMGLLVYDLLWFNLNSAVGAYMTIMLIVSWGLFFLYFFMRLYIYLMIITFDLKLTKILKNAAFFAILGFKRNFMALLAVVLLAVLTLGLMFTFMPLGVVIPFTVLFSLGGFTGVYCAYPKIKQVMIDPYYAEHPDEDPDNNSDDYYDDEDIDESLL